LQELIRFLTLYLAAAVEVGAAVIVAFAAGEAMVRAVSGLLKGQSEAVPEGRNSAALRPLARAGN
jgi:hypothetical protein